MKKNKKDLKWGYSTGACMSALALAAWHYFQSKTFAPDVEVYFLDSQLKQIPLLEPDFTKEIPVFFVQKDGGDDPDCTHKAILYASLEEIHSSVDEAKKEEDYILTIGKDTLILTTIEGIGLSTRIGLDCDKGLWAINKGPREMLVKNLERAGFGKGNCARVWLFALGVEKGKELAKHTLNPILGVVDGISILGTTGHVKPYSNAAYIETIRVCVRSQFLVSGSHVVFSTGGRTQKLAKKIYPELSEQAFVSIADFIAESIKIADEYKMKKVTVACMGGKLCKYAAGLEYTHAHKVKQDMQLLRDEINLALQKAKVFPRENSFANEIENAQSVREALLYLPENIRNLVLEQLAQKALAFFQSLAPSLDFTLLLCDFEGNLLFDKNLQSSHQEYEA